MRGEPSVSTVSKSTLGAIQAAPTRRSVLASGAALTGLAATGLGLTPARAQRRGGHFIVAKRDAQRSDTLDPGTLVSRFMIALSYGLNGYLTGFARDGSVEPQIAERWEVTPDAKTWRFKIRNGVTFHDGRSVTPGTVVTAINYRRGGGVDLRRQAAA